MIFHYRIARSLILTAVLLAGGASWALVIGSGRGMWPDTWPEELEAYRDQSKTLDVRHGIQETVHEIHFDKRENFEKVWPHILNLRSEGGSLILENSPSHYSVSGSEAESGVRILSGFATTPEGDPWPDSILLPSGHLPTYATRVSSDSDPPGLHWAAYDPDRDERQGVQIRVRTDIVLICDGTIVDLNRIPLPSGTPIIDRRFEVESKPVNEK